MNQRNILIVGTTSIDTDTVSTIMNGILKKKDLRTSFTCIGYSEKDYKKRIEENIECIGVKDPFKKIKYRFLRRVFLLLNRDNYALTHEYILRKIVKNCGDKKFDLIASCSGRFCHTCAAYKYAKTNKIPLRIIYFDSFVDNPYTRNRTLREKIENCWFSYANKVFVNVEAENYKWKGINKIEYFKIPINEQNCLYERGHNYIYGGLFYKGIREPAGIIELAEKLDNCPDKIVCFSNCVEQLQHRNISSFGLISHNSFLEECKKAKALIYIGNTGTKAKSSKYLEYISLHKPIIGINVSDDDEVRKYPFFFDADMKDLIEQIDSIKEDSLNVYRPINDYSDRDPSLIYQRFFS